ncbi:hypothetical protein ES706_04465 [subsurface metagenome]
MKIQSKKFKTPLGHEIILLDKTWEKHILKYHEDLFDKRNKIKNILETPEFISYYKKTNSYNCVKGNLMVSYSLIEKNLGYIKSMFKITKNYKAKLRMYIIWSH